MRERLRFGEVAKLLGVTPKTLRHYEEVGLLQQPERSEAGYRLYSADDLLRLHRIKRLRSLGLPLQQVKDVLGEPGSGNELRGVLEALLAEIEGQIRTLETRRNRLREMLSKEDPESPEKTPRSGRPPAPLRGLRARICPVCEDSERRTQAPASAESGRRYPVGPHRRCTLLRH